MLFLRYITEGMKGKGGNEKEKIRKGDGKERDLKEKRERNLNKKGKGIGEERKEDQERKVKREEIEVIEEKM